MNWNLVWEPIHNQTSKFTIYLGDEPILTKTMYGQIYHTNTNSWLTFVENFKFSFENFNEFINDFETGRQAKFSFSLLNGEDSLVYDELTERLTWALESNTSNLHFSFQMDEKTRMQIVGEFKKFLNFYLDYYSTSQVESSSNLRLT
jgi:hypothetical protein